MLFVVSLLIAAQFVKCSPYDSDYVDPTSMENFEDNMAVPFDHVEDVDPTSIDYFQDEEATPEQQAQNGDTKQTCVKVCFVISKGAAASTWAWNGNAGRKLLQMEQGQQVCVCIDEVEELSELHAPVPEAVSPTGEPVSPTSEHGPASEYGPSPEGPYPSPIVELKK
eukprot:TRINITY_DN2902_c0_g1_i1.p6 TRINITY_DN2902_c0_g1~~TRINITY_DN2902_c0_g1_i1.p6  ORF type:complete len:167 (+),score=37.16 TRINITY_DN2902_c0_g1_i1:1422-1922(+)